MDIKLIIFDFDGTLADTNKLIVSCKQETMRRLGLKVMDEKVCASTIGLSAAIGFRQTYPDVPEETIEKCVAVYRALFEEMKQTEPPELFPNVLNTLDALKEKGIKCTIASSRNSQSLNGFLDSMSLKKYFPYVLGGDDTPLLKPNPDPVLRTLEDLGIDAKNTLVIGDMQFDILMGKNAGAYTCGVTYGNADRKTLEEAGADYVVDSIGEILCI